jgi:hypothetical protein
MTDILSMVLIEYILCTSVDTGRRGLAIHASSIKRQSFPNCPRKRKQNLEKKMSC